MKQPTEVDFGSMSDEELQQWLAEKYPGRRVERHGDETVVTIPVNFRRRNGRQMIKTMNLNSEAQYTADVDNHLILAIAKAFQWQDELESGEFGSLDEFAQAKKVDRSYAGRILQLTSLAPQIIQKIIDGESQEGISLRNLRRGIPVVWEDQVW